jgi:hypothetical protein
MVGWYLQQQADLPKIVKVSSVQWTTQPLAQFLKEQEAQSWLEAVARTEMIPQRVMWKDKIYEYGPGLYYWSFVTQPRHKIEGSLATGSDQHAHSAVSVLGGNWSACEDDRHYWEQARRESKSYVADCTYGYVQHNVTCKASQ